MVQPSAEIYWQFHIDLKDSPSKLKEIRLISNDHVRFADLYQSTEFRPVIFQQEISPCRLSEKGMQP